MSAKLTTQHSKVIFKYIYICKLINRFLDIHTFRDTNMRVNIIKDILTILNTTEPYKSYINRNNVDIETEYIDSFIGYYILEKYFNDIIDFRFDDDTNSVFNNIHRFTDLTDSSYYLPSYNAYRNIDDVNIELIEFINTNDEIYYHLINLLDDSNKVKPVAAPKKSMMNYKNSIDEFVEMLRENHPNEIDIKNSYGEYEIRWNYDYNKHPLVKPDESKGSQYQYPIVRIYNRSYYRNSRIENGEPNYECVNRYGKSIYLKDAHTYIMDYVNSDIRGILKEKINNIRTKKSSEFILHEVNSSTNTKINNCNAVETEHSIYNYNIFKLKHIAEYRDTIKTTTNELFSLKFNEGHYTLLLSKATFKDNTTKDYIIFFIDNFQFEINNIPDVKYIISCFNFNKKIMTDNIVNEINTLKEGYTNEIYR